MTLIDRRHEAPVRRSDRHYEHRARYDGAAAAHSLLEDTGGAGDVTAGMTDEELDEYSATLFGTSDIDVSIETHDYLAFERALYARAQWIPWVLDRRHGGGS